MIAAIGLAVWLKAWSAGRSSSRSACVLVVTNLTQHLFLALVAAVCIGAAIGVLNGYLVAKVGIPSFVVTLALFLAWQGVLQFALSRPADQHVATTSSGTTWPTATSAPRWSWVFTIVVVGGYVAYTLVKSVQRQARRAWRATRSAWCCCAAACSPWSAIVITALADQNRNTNPFKVDRRASRAPRSIAIVLMILCTIALTKTTWGRHLYATGGNAEAARRAGIDVVHIKVTAFILCSAFGALGGIMLASSQSVGVARPRLRQRAAVLRRRRGHRRYVALRWPRQAARRHHRRPRDRDHPERPAACKPSLGPQWQQVITGVVLLLAAAVDAVSRRRAARS